MLKTAKWGGLGCGPRRSGKNSWAEAMARRGHRGWPLPLAAGLVRWRGTASCSVYPSIIFSSHDVTLASEAGNWHEEAGVGIRKSSQTEKQWSRWGQQNGGLRLTDR